MAENTNNRLTGMLLSKSRRAQYLKVFAVLAACVVVAVAIVLHQNGVAMTHKEQVLTCPVTGTVAHTHDQSCYDKDGNLVCTLPERELHVHDDSCYTETRTLICGQEESDEHQHTDACYNVSRDLTCGKEEVTEEHVHGPGCFTTVTVQDADDSDNANAGDAEATVQPSANTTEGAAASQSALPAQSFTGLVKDQNDKVVLQVEVTAPEGAFPANTTMKIAAIDSKDVKDTVDKAVTQKSADEVVKDIQAVDITFFNEAGQEIEPLCPITVSMMSDKIANENTNPVLVHVDDEGKGEVVDQLSDKQAAERNVETSDNTLAFDANAFSVYAIAYTVDFHYDVDGETYDFSIPGGGFVSLTDLIEVLGVAEGANSEGNAANPEESTGEDALTLSGTQVSDKTKKFVADVERVEFSSPDLVWVGKVESDSTVGGLKEANGLDVQYSAELTKEQIEQINAQTVKSGDWALISKLPFLSEESLTVTMKNGEVFTIKVTDAQLKKTVISKSGETWEITVTYDDSAKIPNGAELKVTEITKDSSEYSNIRQSIKENVDGKTGDITGVPILFDISIWNGDQEIEPAEGSQVQVEVKLVSDAVKGMYTAEDSPLLIDELPVNDSQAKMTKEMKVLHLKEDKKIDLVESTDTISEGETVSSFTTDSFSNWLLYLDEDVEYINVTTEDSITLRPYSEWIWKKTDELDEYQNGQWTFPSDTWKESKKTENGVQYTIYEHRKNGSKFRSFQKKDDQLNETYTVVTSDGLKAGTFDLQTNKGKTIHVNVAKGAASGKPGTVSGISGLTVNLFDYDVPYVNGQPDFKHSGNLDVSSNKATTPINETVNIGHDLKFLGWGYDGANHGVNSYTQENPVQGVVKDRLGTDGYPVLNTTSSESLAYLFNTSTHNSSVYAFPNADGLFQQDKQGYYYYNSNSNYAEYDQTSNTFTLYEHTYSQNTGGSNGANAKPIGFFPFHEYDTVNTQPSMNHNKDLNHHFGMSMAVDFEIPQDRMAPDPSGNRQPIIYEFSGDDDLWVFIDNELVLDIGGLHQPVTGTINFTTGEISVHGVKDKTMTFEVGSHTLKMFYLERGGCDSNLSVRFNLPLILGKGSVRAVKKSKTTDTANADMPLIGALFGIWDNPNCEGDPYTIATSDQNGVISKDLPIREEGQKFYMKEIAPPGGYLLDNTIFTLTAGTLDDNGNCDFEISSGGVAISDKDNTGSTIIRNQAVAPINIEVKKEWQNADGTPMSAVPEDLTATFTVKRLRTYSTDPLYTVVLRDQGNSTVKFDTILAHAGDKLTIKYRHAADSKGTSVNCGTANGAQEVLHLPTNKTGDEINVTYTVNASHAENGEIQILIPDWFTNWCHAPDYQDGYDPRFVGIQTASHNTVTEIDPTYNQQVTLTSQDNWRKTLSDLIVQGTDSATTTLYHYEYYVVETSIPNGYQALYPGSINNDPSSQATNISGTQTVVNKQLNTNITLKKVAKDQLNADNPPTLKNATFRIEKYTSNSYNGLDTSWGNDGCKSLTDDDDNGEFSIEGLSTGFYKIVETRCPDGYIKCSEDPTFEVKMNDTTKELEIVLLNSNQLGFVKYNKNDATLLYGNEPGEALPSTGGFGTTSFTIIGSMLFAGAGAMLVMKKRRSAE